EIYEMESGRLLRRLVPPSDRLGGDEPFASLTSGGSILLVRFGGVTYEIELPEVRTQRHHGTETPMAISTPGDWVVSQDEGANQSELRLLLRRVTDERFWVSLTSDPRCTTGQVGFSPNARYLTWRRQDGSIAVADLPALELEVSQFEGAILSK